MTTTRTRRWLTSAAAIVTAATLLAGCGGSDVDQAAAPDAVGAAEGTTETTGAEGAPAATEVGPGGAQAASETGADAGAQSAPAATAGTTTTAGTNAGTKVPGAQKPSSGNKKTGDSSSGASAAAGSAVEKLVASAPIFGGSGACKPATLSEIPLGNVSTMSGVLGELLSPVRPALETFIASQNACGGLNGHKIKMYFDDDQGDPSTASTKVQKMIQDKKVLAFVGNIQVLTIDAVVPIIKRAGIPMIGGDLVSYTWYTNPLLFPQGAPPGGVGYGYLKGTTEYHKKKNVGIIWCIEVPRACEQLNRSFIDLAPEFGATMKKSIQASITQPSYVQQCLEFKNAGVEAIAMALDAASMNRLARSCDQVGFTPSIVATSLGVGNERQFLTGNKWLGNSYVPMNYFPWFANETAAQKYWQASVKKYNPGFPMGGAASTGWISGALLVAAAAELSATNPTTAELLKGLYQFQGQKWTEMGGLNGPLLFREGKTPKIPYCMFGAISNADNTGWAKAIAKPQCTDKVAPSDPQKNS